jgi:hypothetical protein
MNGNRMVAIVLIVGGVLALVYGGFSYTKNTEGVDLGIVKLEVKEKERVNVPLWLGVVAVGGGAAMLMMGGKRV